MKKLISLLLAFVMVLSLATVAFALENETNHTVVEDGTITIANITADNHYEIYKMLHLDTYESASGNYNYKVESKWETFFTTTDALTYFAVGSDGYVTWIAATDDATVAAFAQKALAYAKQVNADSDPTNDIAPEKSSRNSGEFDITGPNGKFSGLTLGYYLVDSTVGALCGLTTTNPNASVTAKNGTPILDKQVQEDSTGHYGDKNTADIGQTVNFRTTIDVHDGAENYVLHDTMTAGLTFKEITSIKHVIPGTPPTETEVPSTYYTIVTTPTDSCTFEVRFNNDFCHHLNTNDKVVVEYTATVNEDAIIGSTGDVNETWLDFGEGNHTTHDKTYTYTYGIEIVKTDSEYKLIDGAEFKIFDAETGGNEIKLVKTSDTYTNGNPIYRVAIAGETPVDSIVVKDGIVRVNGFDNGTYYIEETKQPVGYELLAGRRKFIIADANLEAIFVDGDYTPNTGVHVINKSGTKLPETGATGTAMFIFFGMFVMLTTGVLLVTKKRMSMIEE